ncbi:acetyltransferase (GNAT) family domain-containing protein [Metarhizium brunneum]
MALPGGYHLRAGTAADLRTVTGLYLAGFGHDGLLDIMFPGRRRHPDAVAAFLYRHFRRRWWTMGWRLTVVVDETLGVPVGFTWWLRPASQLTFWETWVSPYAWFAPLVRMYLCLEALVLRSPIDPGPVDGFYRAVRAAEPQFLTTPRRREAWYLSTLAVHPVYQGQRLGRALVQEGLELVDKAGSASYLVGLRSVEAFYPKYGFKEVCRVNVGELKAWDGGSVMFRE